MAPPPISQAPRPDDAPLVGPGLGGGLVQLPEHSRTVTEVGPQVTTERRSQDPERKRLLGLQAGAVQDQVEARGDLTTAEAATQNQKALDAEAAAKENDRYLAQMAKETAQLNEAVAAKQAESARRRDAMEAASKGRATSYWADKGAPAEILSHFIVGLSERSHRLAGGQAGASPMQQALDRALAEDQRIKMAKFEDSKEFLQLAKEDVVAAEAAKAKRRAEISDEHIVMVNSLAKRAEAQVARLQIPELQAKGRMETGAILERGSKALADQRKDYEDTVKTESARRTVQEVDNRGKNTAGPAEVATRQSLLDTESSMTEMAKLARDNPAAVARFAKLAGEWKTVEKIEGMGSFGKGVRAFSTFFGSPATLDAALKDEDPATRRFGELYQKAIFAEAQKTGGAIKDSDIEFVEKKIGVFGKSPKEVAASAEEYGRSAAAHRRSLEANKTFRDQLEPPPAPTPAAPEPPPAPVNPYGGGPTGGPNAYSTGAPPAAAPALPASPSLGAAMVDLARAAAKGDAIALQSATDRARAYGASNAQINEAMRRAGR